MLNYFLQIVAMIRIFIILFVLFTSGCFSPQRTDIVKDFEWLSGTWKLLDAKTNIYEAWHLEGEEWQGESYAAVNGMKVPTEKIKLYKEKGFVIYSQRVKDRDDGAPVDFVLTERGKNRFTFSNSKYTFPQTITYNKVGDVGLKIKLTGEKDGQPTVMMLEYVRK